MHVGLIRSYGGKLLTKSYRLDPPSGLSWGDAAPDSVVGTWRELDAVGRGVFLHGYREQPISGLAGLRDFLIGTATDHTVALIQGRLRPGAALQVEGQWQDVLGRTQENYEDYARNLLVLDLDEIAGDVADAPDIVRDTLYEVPELDMCAHVACFSPSAGVKPGIRVRVFIVTTDAHTLVSQRAFVRFANERAGRKLFDDSIYGPQSFTALAAPLLIAETSAGARRLQRPVPQPVAWYCDGDPADIGVSKAAAQVGIDPRDIEYIEQYQGPAADKVDWMEQITAGNVALPLHRALCRAAFAAPDDKQAQYFTGFVASARRKILELDPAEYARREREHLNVRRLQDAWDKARTRRQSVKPAYSTKIHPQVVSSVLTPRQQLAQDVVAAAKSILAGTPAQVLVSSPPGAGKSFALKGILDPGTISSNSILTVAPTHELSDQLTTDHKQHAESLAPGGNYYGLDLPAMIRHHKGRKLLCKNDKHGKMAERAEKIGISAKKTACASCPDKDACAWLAQAHDDGSGEKIMPHAAIFNQYTAADDWADMTIADENIIGSVIDDSVPSEMQIEKLAHTGGFAKLKDARAHLMMHLLDSIPRGQSERSLVASKFTADQLDFWLQLEEKHRDTISKNLVTASESKFDRDLQHIVTSRFVTALLSNMQDSHRLPHYKAIRVYHAKGHKWVATKRRLFMQENILAKGAIHLDGTARLDPGLSVWKALISPDGAPFEHHVIDVQPVPGNVKITQVVDASFAKSALLHRPDAALDEAIQRAQNIASAKWIANALADDPAAQRLQQGAAAMAVALDAKRTGRKQRADSRLFAIWLTVLKQAFKHSETLLVAQLDVIDALSKLGLPSNVRKAHFGALRGLNHFKNVPAATIVGRPALDNHQLELHTEALFVRNDAVAAIPHAEAWGKQELPVTLSDGASVTIQCDGHPDANCRSLQALISHAEVAQAVARIRPYDRGPDNPCEVAVFGQWPVGLPVDRVCALSDVRPDECDVALAALGVFDDAATTIEVFSGLYNRDIKESATTRRIALDYVRVALRTWLASDTLSDASYSPDLPLLREQQAQVAHAQVASQMVNTTVGISHIRNRESEYLKTDMPTDTLTIACATEYQFVELLVVGHHNKARRPKKVTAIVRKGATVRDIERRSGLKLGSMRVLTRQQVRKYGLQLVRGLIAYECKRSPALAEFAGQIGDDIGMLEFVETWLGWGLRG